MYLELQGIPTDKDLQTYHSVHLTSSHENGIHLYWTMSTQRTKGEPDWAIDSNERFQFDPNFHEFGDDVNRSLSIFDILDDTPQISQTHHLLVNKHAFHQTPIDYDKLRP